MHPAPHHTPTGTNTETSIGLRFPWTPEAQESSGGRHTTRTMVRKAPCASRFSPPSAGFLLATLTLLSVFATIQVVPEPAQAAFDEQFVWPMSGSVTSIYWECRSDCARYHRGIDIANGCDTPIYAARAGTVSHVGWDAGGYGHYIILNHDHGYETLYAHMVSTNVNEGQSVTTSTIIGYEGTTGGSTGCHVHFEVRQQGNGASAELKQFVPGKIGEQKTRGVAIPYDMRLFELTTTRSVLDGPNLNDVPGQGDEPIGTAHTGDRYVAYSSWVNGGTTWYAIDFNGRIGWLPASTLDEVGGTVQRITTDGALNVRSGPGTANTDIGDVWGGQEYARLASGNDGGGTTWYQIHYDGTDGAGTGWVHGGYTQTLNYDDPNPPPGEDLTGWYFAVDPGHGGTDPGAEGFGTYEKEVNLAIALELRDLLVADGADVLMTREGDETVSLQERTDMANNAGVDRFVSIHANSCGGCGARGTETYYHDSLPPTSQAADLANNAQSRIISEVGTNDRGVKQADFHVLRETQMPAILVETAFLDQADDHAILTNAAHQEAIARAILHGIQEHLDVPVHDPDEGGGGGGDPDPNTPNLVNGETVSITGSAGDEAFYKIEVPSDATSLTFDMTGPECSWLTGCPVDADLYVRHGQRPTGSEWDCRPYTTGNDETCTFDAPQGGWWYARVHFYDGSGTVDLVATHDGSNDPDPDPDPEPEPDPDPSVPNLENGESISVSLSQGEEAFYKIEVPSGQAELEVVMDGPDCSWFFGCPVDADLYVRYDARPSASEWDCRPYEGDADETCTFQNPAGGWWYVRLYGYEGSGTVTLTATYG